MDPLAETSRSLTTYSYASNNPINRFDSDGQKDKPFNSKTDQTISVQPGTATIVYIRDSEGKPIAYAPGRQNAYNCHSYAWDKSQGDPNDPEYPLMLKIGIPKWDNSPANNIKEQRVQQLGTDEPNEVGDKVIYYIDSNGNGLYDDGEKIEHSAIVNSVDKDGYTTTVIGKMGEDGISINHPNAPDYYDHDSDKNSTSRAYFRNLKKTDQKNTTSSTSNTLSWNQASQLIGSWLKQNPSIIITIK
jgi:hypothetical protein